MTHPWAQVPTPPEPPQWQQAPPTRPLPKQSTTATTVTILLASILGLSLFAAALLALSDLAATPGPGRGLSVGILIPGDEEPAATNPTPTYPEPKLSDFTLKVKERRRQKFGPAGANITYHIVAGWGPNYDPDKTYALIYEVHGGEDGRVRNYMAIRGDHHHKIENDQFISTPHVNQRLIVKAVAVEELAGGMFTPRSCQPH
jgi:hypothetical protein